jgi:hypothetical protein
VVSNGAAIAFCRRRIGLIGQELAQFPGPAGYSTSLILAICPREELWIVMNDHLGA